MELSFHLIEKITRSLGERYVKIASALAFLGLGAMVGLAARSYLRFLLISFIICFFTIKGLEYNHILNINWALINSIIGLPASAGINDIVNLAHVVCKNHPIQTLSSVVGMFVGFYFG